MGDVLQHLHWIDLVIIGIYMVGTLALGTFFGRYVKNASDFFIAGKALPFWAIGMSVVVTDIGATDFIATAGSGYSFGIAAANFDWMGSMPAMVFAAFIFIPFYWRSGVFTIPEFLGRRYNVAVQMIHGSIWGIFLLVMLAVMLWLTANLMTTILGGEQLFWVWFIVAMCGIYTFSGGLSAVVITDVIQLVVMFVGGGALLAIALYEVGGFGALRENITSRSPELIITYAHNDRSQTVPDIGFSTIETALKESGFDVEGVSFAAGNIPKHMQAYRVDLGGLLPAAGGRDEVAVTRSALAEHIESLAPENVTAETQIRKFDDFFRLLLPHDSSTPFPWTGIVFGLGIVMATAYMAGNQAVVQRTLGARSEWDAKGGMLFGGFLKVFIPFLVIVPGLCAVKLIPGLYNGDEAVQTMIREYLPPGLMGLMFAALFAALMSSVDSTLNSATTIWTTDIIGRIHRIARGKELEAKVILLMGRTLTVVFIISAGYFAKYFAEQDTMYVFIQTALSMFQGPVLAILLLGILWKRATQWGGLAGLILGVCFTTILNNTEGVFPSDDPMLFVAWWSFVFSLIVTVVVSLVTPPEPDEKIRGLIFRQLLEDDEVQSALKERVAE